MQTISSPLGRQRNEAIPLGGPGSGHWGHAGRPGYQGGSAPSSQGKYQIGVTSATDDKTDAQTEAELPEFEQRMQATGVKDLSVSIGRGAWQGGHEQTFITSYVGNGEAMKALAQYGKDMKQHAILIQKYTSARDPKGQPQNRLTFDHVFDSKDIAKMEELLADAGFDGWTWFNKGGKTSLMLTNVPQWGGEKEAHLASVASLAKDIAAGGIEFVQSQLSVIVSIMEEDTYDDYL